MAGLDKSRATLRPRAKDILQQLVPPTPAQQLDAAANAPVENTPAATEPDTTPENSNQEVTQKVDDTAPTDGSPAPVSEPEPAPEPAPTTQKQPTVADSDTSDDDWLSDLVAIQPPAPPQTQQPTAYQPPAYQPPAYNPPAEPDTPQTPTQDEEFERWKSQQRFSGLTTVDPEVAQELYEKIFKPELDQIKDQAFAEARKSQTQVEQLSQQRAAALREKTNTKILTAFPEAMKVLGSVQFADWVNASANPYATEKPFDILQRSYENGDAEYVIDAIAQFKNSRIKPKPQVSVESAKGGSTNQVIPPQGERGMTDEEYLIQRKKIMSAPRGTYPPGALQKLTEKYNATRKTR